MNISFSATTDQARRHQKHCTRRLDKSLRLSKLKPGQILQGIEKAQGIKKGEHIVKMDQITIIEVNREPLDEIIRRPVRTIPDYITNNYFGYFAGKNQVPETTLEGFPDLNEYQFVKKFCEINPKCKPDTEITRILFDYMEEK